MTKVLQIGLVGLGKIARDQHLPAIAATAGARLTAIASRNATMAGVNNYQSLAQMLGAEPMLDVVILCQPPEARFEAAQSAIAAGKHVFLEKPPGATVSEVETLVGLAKQHGVTLFASWHSRFGAAVPLAKKWTAEHNITSVKILWKEDIRHWHPGQDWILQPGGFGVFDPGINALSILTEIMPEPIRLVEATLRIPSNRRVPIAADLEMKTASDVAISATFDFLQTGPQLWDIMIEAGNERLRLAHGGNKLWINGSARNIGFEAEYPSMYNHFVDLIRDGKIDVDVTPLQLVADAFSSGRMIATDPFDF